MHPMDITARTRIGVGIAGRDLSDYARALVELAADVDTEPASLSATAAAMRKQSLLVQDRAVLADRAAGATWAEIGDAIGLTADETRARYEATYERWVKAGDTVGFLPKATSATPMYGRVTDDTTADAVCVLDLWLARHIEPWSTLADARFEDLLTP